MEKNLSFNVGLGRRLIFFLCATVFCFAIGSLLVSVLVYLKGMTPAMMRISAVMQDVIVFIAPSLITAVIITRLPAKFLAIESKPKGKIWILACLILILSLPAMNSLISWNESIELPSALKGIEEGMRNAEARAQESVNLLIGGDSVGAIIVSILIVGVLAGLSEELFFRGTMQRLLTTGGVNVHVAIWVVAFIFSATHLQFYGFFARLILGAYFGYLLYWTRCLWIPVIVHVFNNSVYVLGNRFVGNGAEELNINNVGVDSVWLVLLSIVLTVVGLVLLRKQTLKGSQSRI